MVAADVIIRSLSVTHHLISAHPWASGQLPAMMLGAAAFFVVNTGLVGVAVALYQGMPIVRYFRNDFGFVVVTGGVMVLISPIVLAAAAYSVAIVPLCLAPVLAMYNSVSRGARSEHAARHDSLTGLPNRAAFHEAVGAARLRRAGSGLHPAHGPRSLQGGQRHARAPLRRSAARRRSPSASASAIGADGRDRPARRRRVRGRLPGSRRRRTLELATRLGRASLGAAFELEAMVVDVQASIGVALFPEHGAGVETLLQKADVAMYRAKETRQGLALYDERHDHNSPAKLALTAELRNAVETDEIVVWFQPELDLRTGEVIAVEALVRWEHPGAGRARAERFVGSPSRPT